VAGKTKKRRERKLDWLQPAVLTGSIVPFVVIAWRGGRGQLGANPVATALNQLGLLTLVFLMSSLACTPVKIATGFKWPMRLRRTLGVMAFVAALSHFLVYLVFDQVLMLRAVLRDVLMRPFIAIGFIAFVLLIPLAWTSTKQALQRMGPKRWKRLHRLAYLCGILGVVHFTMRVKKDLTEPLVYGAILTVLFAIRIFDFLRRRARARLRART
jgi:sulfoxide reductase heme-binding subunit YedZ